MHKAIIVVAAAVILMVTGVVLAKTRIQSAAPSSRVISTFELMSTAKDLPVAPQADAF